MKKKKISFISRTGRGWHKNELEKAANKFGLDFEAINITNLNNLKNDIERLGDLVFYRTSSLDLKTGRTTFLSVLAKKRIVVNQAIYKTPLVANKLYQQKIIERIPAIDGIDSFQFKKLSEVEQAIRQGRLKYPFVMKANLSARGEKVFLIKDSCNKVEQYCEKPLTNYLFQNFIKNSGDFRVLVLGGKALGVMKRVAAKGEFKNNISLGGTGSAVTDRKHLNDLAKIAVKAAAVFGLQFCGVDIIYDEQEQRYKVMEINTAAQWRGFQETTGIVVADELMAYFKSLLERKELDPATLVLQNYDQNYDYLYNKQFHYASRLYLWTRRDLDKKRLIKLKPSYLGANKQEYQAKLKAIMAKDRKYPKIINFNDLFFSVLFGFTLYGIDLRDCLDKIVDQNQVLKLRAALINDLYALAGLSTLAINFLYNSQFSFPNGPKFSPSLILKAADLIDENKSNDWLRLKFYLLTHAIIGESQFYFQKVKTSSKIYQQMIKQLEVMVGSHFFDLSLDNKLEFLVCCQLVGYKSQYEQIIFSEADNSFSDIGNFLVDKTNKNRSFLADEMMISEHRNVLYLMSKNKRTAV